MQIRCHRKYTSKDKIQASRKFKTDIDKKIGDLRNFPYKNRKSIYFDDENIRDMIYKGYTITYEINSQIDTIEILDIFNQNK